ASEVPGFPGLHAALSSGPAKPTLSRHFTARRESARCRSSEMKSSHRLRSRGTGETKPFLCSRIPLVIAALSALLFCGSARAWGQDAAAFFKQNCTSCHTIGGGRLTGPDLKDVTSRRDHAWLVQFLQSPKAMIDSGDPYALKLQQEARGVVMPNIAGMNPQQAQELLDMITAESKQTRSQFAGMQISDRPLTAQDVAK